MKISILLMLAISSCQLSSQDARKLEQPKKPTSEELGGDFKQYWKKLGYALRINDTLALDEYLDATIFVYGREDSDPRFTLNGHDRILKVREVYLSGGTYDFYNDLLISYQDFFSDNSALENRYIEGEDIQDIEDFAFRKNASNEWKLIGVYCNTR
jgi:hypothetical protein